MAEYIKNTGSPDDPWYECPCGNTPQDSGFYACDEHGNPQTDDGGGPLPSWQGEHLRCENCGRYFAMTDLLVRGFNRAGMTGATCPKCGAVSQGGVFCPNGHGRIQPRRLRPRRALFRRRRFPA
jgi:hypothetical protein